MKLIHKDSILYYLPKELSTKEFLIFDAIRFSLEIIQTNYNSLEYSLIRTSETNNRNVSKTFNYVWNIIDYTNRIKDLLSELPWQNQAELLGPFYSLKEFRDTFQHLGIRSNTVVSQKTAIYGLLTWFYRNPKTKKFKTHKLLSGVGRRAEMKVTVPDITKFNRKINSIQLHSVKKKKIITADINKVVHDLVDLRTNLERRIHEFYEYHNFEISNWDDRRDLHFVVKPKDYE